MQNSAKLTWNDFAHRTDMFFNVGVLNSKLKLESEASNKSSCKGQ